MFRKNKRFIMSIVMSFIILSLSMGCAKTTTAPIEAVPDAAVEQPVAQTPEVAADPLESLKNGEIPEIKFPLGTPGDEVALRLGDPESEDWFSGHYLQYGHVMYYTDGQSPEQRGNLTAILIAEKGVVFGQPVGAPVKNVRTVFGDPVETGWMPAEAELFPGEWYMTYKRNDYLLHIYANSDKGEITGFMISRTAQ